MRFSILQSEKPGKFNIIAGQVSPAGYPVGVKGKDWDYLYINGGRVLVDMSIEHAREFMDLLNNGAVIGDCVQ